MQAAPQCAKRSLVDRFAPCRMGADGAGDVLEHRPHFNGKCQRQRQFRNSRPHRLRPQHEVIVGARDDPHETLIIHLRQRPAIGGEGKCRDLARQQLGNVQGERQDVHGAVPSVLTGDRPTISTERSAGCRAKREQRTAGSWSGLVSTPKSMAAPPSPSTIIRNFDHLQPKALHIGQKLGRRGKRVRGNGPEDDG